MKHAKAAAGRRLGKPVPALGEGPVERGRRDRRNEIRSVEPVDRGIEPGQAKPHRIGFGISACFDQAGQDPAPPRGFARKAIAARDRKHQVGVRRIRRERQKQRRLEVGALAEQPLELAERARASGVGREPRRELVRKARDEPAQDRRLDQPGDDIAVAHILVGKQEARGRRARVASARRHQQLPRPAPLPGLLGKRGLDQERFGLEPRPGVPLFGVVSRLAAQKGLDLLAEALPRILDRMDVQFVLLGNGEAKLENDFRWAAEAYRGRFGAHLGFDGGLAPAVRSAPVNEVAGPWRSR